MIKEPVPISKDTSFSNMFLSSEDIRYSWGVGTILPKAGAEPGSYVVDLHSFMENKKESLLETTTLAATKARIPSYKSGRRPALC